MSQVAIYVGAAFVVLIAVWLVMASAQQQRLDRALTQRMYFLGFEHAPDGPWTFHVQGSTLSQYDVKIDAQGAITCTCPDFERAQSPCKHVYLTLVRALRQPPRVDFRLADLPQACREHVAWRAANRVSDDAFRAQTAALCCRPPSPPRRDSGVYEVIDLEADEPTRPPPNASRPPQVAPVRPPTPQRAQGPGHASGPARAHTEAAANFALANLGFHTLMANSLSRAIDELRGAVDRHVFGPGEPPRSGPRAGAPSGAPKRPAVARRSLADDPSCVVCMEDMQASDALEWCDTSCGRAYHRQCLDVWRAKHATCPLCRAPWPRPLAAPAGRPAKRRRSGF